MKNMSSKNAGPRLQCLGFAVLALGLIGCNSVGFKTGDTTAGSLLKASRTVQAESRALDASIGRLNDLVNSPAQDVKPQFKAYSKSIKELLSAVEDSDRAVAELREQSQAYFQAWDTELSAMNYEIIRTHSEARKSAVSNQVNSLCQRYDETQAVVRPLISYLSDIQRNLGMDLTFDGLVATREIVRNASANTQKIQSALAQMATEFSDSGVRLSTVADREEPRPAPAQTAGNAHAEAGMP